MQHFSSTAENCMNVTNTERVWHLSRTVYDTQFTSIPSAINFLTRSVWPNPQASQNSSCFVAAKPITATQTHAHNCQSSSSSSSSRFRQYWYRVSGQCFQYWYRTGKELLIGLPFIFCIFLHVTGLISWINRLQQFDTHLPRTNTEMVSGNTGR